MPTVRQLLDEAVPILRAAGVETPILDAELLMSGVLGCSRTEIMAHEEITPPPASMEQFRDWTNRRARREPLAYILGVREFYGLTFEVTPAVLIPRQETEFLVECAVDFLESRPSPVVADVGVGSGCVAVAVVKSVPAAMVYGTDTSRAALDVARSNARRHGVEERTRFVQGDLLGPLQGIEFDMVISNPPYIPTDEMPGLQPEVSDYEPRQALDGGPDGLDVIRRLVCDAGALLKPGGALAVEIGVGEWSGVECIFRTSGFHEVRSIKDYSHIERVVMGVWR